LGGSKDEISDLIKNACLRSIHQQSALLANDTYGDFKKTNDDLSIVPGSVTTGSHNLIRISNAPVRADTIVEQYPILGKLCFNGE
jgi:hypothetical protein